MTTDGKDFGERITALEVSVAAMRDDVSMIKASVSGSARTNWGVVFSGVALMGGLYAAAIRPVENDVTRLAVTANTQALAVLEQNKIITAHEIAIATLAEQMHDLKADVKMIAEQGSPATNVRLAILEYKAGVK